MREHRLPDFWDESFAEPVVQIMGRWVAASSAYLMALTAVMHGGECRFYRGQKAAKTDYNIFPETFEMAEFFSVTFGSKTVFFWAVASPYSCKKSSANEAEDKVRSKPLLHHAGVRTPFGGAAASFDLSLLDQFEKHGVMRLCLKPASGSMGRGVMGPITPSAARTVIKANPRKHFVVEQYLQGDEFRVTVVADRIVSIVQRHFPNVEGDGTSTIEELLQKKIEIHKSNPRCAARPYKLNEISQHLKLAGITKTQIPKKGAVIKLTSSGVWEGGDVTNVPLGSMPEIEDQCLKAAKCFSLKVAGIDVIVPANNPPYILEVNSKPGVEAGMFPFDGGWSLDIPEAILKMHFPRMLEDIKPLKKFDYMQMARDYIDKPEVNHFDVADYVTFA